jgi:hypothetical protein
MFSEMWKQNVLYLSPKRFLKRQPAAALQDPVPTFPFVLWKVLTIHIERFKLAAGYDGCHIHCGSFQVCLVTYNSSRNLLLHEIFLFSKTPSVFSF